MKVFIGCFMLILLCVHNVSMTFVNAENWRHNKGTDGGCEGCDSLLNESSSDNSSVRSEEVDQMGGLQSASSRGRLGELDTHKRSVNTSFLSGRIEAINDDDDTEDNNDDNGEDGSDDDDGDNDLEEEEEEGTRRDDNGIVKLNVGNKNETLVNQLTILKDITDKVKKEKNTIDFEKVYEEDIPSIAEEERKINEFYEYENKVLEDIRKKKKNIYAMINEDLDELLKPAQKEYMKVARSIKSNLLHEYEQILKEELSEE
ncbi:hypothetical protein, conserved [Plasmodium gonderi]|uniref:Uncharacterized protein n=1 Tax=Plasmodium gonderi TaxID=77519 RepID=A0A1Y1JGC8_PLAGO|nr:hypothetical protein, conserved [Plasmodium gonderi]GAW81579.1 hypothetical protein, conserved [Plasmodium gonderi]